MFFSKSCEYALRATMFLAQEEEHNVGIHTIAQKLDIPESYLSKVMQQLVKEGVVSSIKGRNGGFFLSSSEINEPLIRIVQAIDGPNVFLKCGLGIKDCSNTKPCPLHNDIKAYRENLKLALSNSSIKSTKKDIASGEFYLQR